MIEETLMERRNEAEVPNQGGSYVFMQQERGLCMADAFSYSFQMYNSRNRQEPRNLMQQMCFNPEQTLLSVKNTDVIR